ncbi:TetR/AcrR family transcriptional regulator [Staphylococcus lutrae]|uniref:TetR family transcriptional regulator n=1 Tax=Staphylococcus lutrae TaxID=155085 RepID=A0AAC9RNY3_9STAP|nr:TetR/AcrR family transcriptional regulator [Staphylococcus lutrae]ARJ50766.1 TetR family transcriptional regulator [Staphylococcus lutrae]PNZ36123.1 TetR/AcrR family transcriptional regulator [Staphylococcus lutrae]
MKNQEKTKRLDARRNKKKILMTVSQMLHENSDLESINMTAIAKRAEVGVGTLYRHFASKSLLCQAVINDQISDMFDEIESFLAAYSEASMYDRIYGVLEIFIKFKERNLNLLSFIEKHGLKENSFSAAPFYHDLYRILENEIAKQDEMTDVQLKLDLLLNGFSSDVYLFERFTRGYSKEKYLNKLLEIYLK